MKKNVRITLSFFTFAIAAIAVLIIVFSAVAPLWLEKKLLPGFVKDLGIEGFDWEVRRLGISGADFGDIKAGDKNPKAISIDSIQLDYSLAELLQGRLKSVRIIGARIYFEIIDGKIRLPGIDVEQIFKGVKPSSAAGSEKTAEPAFQVQTASLENAMLHGKLNDNHVSLPLDLTVKMEGEKLGKIEIIGLLFPFGNEVQIKAEIGSSLNRLNISCDAANINPENITGLFFPSPALKWDGDFDFAANAELTLVPFTCLSAEASFKTKYLTVKTGGVKAGKSWEDENLFFINAKKKGENFSVSASGASILSPFKLALRDFTADISQSGKKLVSEFSLSSEWVPTDNRHFSIRPPLQINGNGTVKLKKGVEWLADMEIQPGKIGNRQEDRWRRLRWKDFDTRLFLPAVKISGEGDLIENKFHLNWRASGARMEADAFYALLPVLTGDVKLGRPEKKDDPISGKNENQQLQFFLTLKDPDFRSTATSAKFSQVSLYGKIQNFGDKNMQAATRLNVEGGNAADEIYNASVDGVFLDLPVIWPFEGRPETGTLNLETLKWKGKKVGKISAKIRQNGFGASIKGSCRSEIIPGLEVFFKGSASQKPKGLETKFDFGIKNYQIGPELDVGEFIAAAKGLNLKGLLAFKGSFFRLGTKVKSAAEVQITDLDMDMEDPPVAVNGVQIGFSIPDIFEFRSRPHQKITFDSAKLGNIAVSDGTIQFQMESRDSVFIEKSNFKWCNGNVDASAVKMSFPLKNFRMTLYCDRLNLSSVLEQLGGVQGEGGGAVNGRIPVIVENSNIKFDDGFLYSTPGAGGIIRLVGTDRLMAGIPKGTPQFAQIELAQEALKEYAYDWAKINITTREKNLHLDLKLDGKPVGVLPFRFDEEFGGFVRVEGGHPGSRFQGIRLDVNLKLPLEEVLKHGMSLKGALDRVR